MKNELLPGDRIAVGGLPERAAAARPDAVDRRRSIAHQTRHRALRRRRSLHVQIDHCHGAWGVESYHILKVLENAHHVMKIRFLSEEALFNAIL